MEDDEWQAKLESIAQAGLDAAGLGDTDMSPLKQDGHLANELFNGYVEAGFSERQAVYLVAAIITGNPGHAPVN